MAQYLKAFEGYAVAAAAASGTASTLAVDLQSFLSSTGEGGEVPASLRQLGRLLQSDELQGLLRKSAATLAEGVAQGAAAVASGGAAGGIDGTSGASSSRQSVLGTVLEAVLSDRGHSLLGVAVGVASKNVSTALVEFLERMQAMQAMQGGEGSGSGLSMAGALRMLVSEDGSALLSLLITKSISTAVSTYCDATAGVNVYADMVAAVVKKENRDAVSDVMARSTGAFVKELSDAVGKAYASSSQVGGAGAGGAGGGAGTTGAAAGSAMPGGGASSMQLAHAPGQPDDVPSTRTSLESPHTSSNYLRQGIGGGMASISGRRNVLPPQPQPQPDSGAPPWLRQAVRIAVGLAKQKELRALALDVAGATARESTRAGIEAIAESVRLPSIGSLGSQTLGVIPALYLALALACMLLAYMAGARGAMHVAL
ncbi:hypothetical protein FOA52_006616 [Chlamydomonas sp. UWO 241]|nr:hypothetical protein FOA52_006616 [Chlamydomonas sp. UWO 241]